MKDIVVEIKENIKMSRYEDIRVAFNQKDALLVRAATIITGLREECKLLQEDIQAECEAGNELEEQIDRLLIEIKQLRESKVFGLKSLDTNY